MPHTQPPRQLKVPTHVKLSEVIIACKIQIQYKYNTNSIQIQYKFNSTERRQFILQCMSLQIMPSWYFCSKDYHDRKEREDTEAVTCGLYIGCYDSHVYGHKVTVYLCQSDVMKFEMCIVTLSI